MKRLLAFTMLLGIAGVAALSGQLQSAHGSVPGTIPSHIGGVVPIRGGQVQGSGDLIYHGGPVMTTNNTYAIFWIPSGSTVASNYIATINQYFTDVAHDSGMSTNVYAADTQYSSIQYKSTFVASVTDTTAFPTSGCPVYTGVTECLTDNQLQAEIDSVINSHGWTRNGTNMFFLFTPKDVGSCFDSSGSQCTYTTYCAYHGTSNSGAIYANQPYTVSATYPGNCDVGQYPNSSDADPTINVTSHEHNEAITDPQLNAWYDSAGFENGDKCAWDFGPVQGPSGAEYNQTINGHHYWLQREYSNNGHLCVQTYTIQSGGGSPSVSFFFPTRGRAGTTVVLQGSHFTGTTKVTIHGAKATFTVNSDTRITTRVPIGAPAGYGYWAVTNSSGTGQSKTQFYVG